MSLTNLDLSGNMIGVHGADRLAAALQHNSTLASLQLVNNRIEDEGAYLLAVALEGNRTVTSLGLNFNSIGDPGADFLASALEHNPNVTHIDLQDNDIGEESADRLASALRRNAAGMRIITLWCTPHGHGSEFCTIACTDIGGAEVMRAEVGLKTTVACLTAAIAEDSTHRGRWHLVLPDGTLLSNPDAQLGDIASAETIRREVHRV
eukprot:gnl/TRDRNA2_/TRDRNA2_168553_c2_seq3.p2 gnl/TRDRNA2_/TRDRNA2_168553_c2~~gnl/TRDRNA2_/TRDRNA2_168553_c2_seq3.p2  ORF type:complete len:207 (+),score=27.81 gnl/TRDRNA2_/TRDRNA2_168553_c2_seq3:191-811(+)